MKRLTQIFVVAVLLFVTTSALQAQTVYVTEGGKKYHAKNCSVVKTGKTGMELKDAKKKGYEPCNVCKKDDITPAATDDKKKTAAPKK